jgi:hypothetical protein
MITSGNEVGDRGGHHDNAEKHRPEATDVAHSDSLSSFIPHGEGAAGMIGESTGPSSTRPSPRGEAALGVSTLIGRQR